MDDSGYMISDTCMDVFQSEFFDKAEYWVQMEVWKPAQCSQKGVCFPSFDHFSIDKLVGKNVTWRKEKRFFEGLCGLQIWKSDVLLM